MGSNNCFLAFPQVLTMSLFCPIVFTKQRDRTSTRGGRGARTGGRARRSADDPDALNDEPAATSEEAAQNGQTSVKAVVEGVEKNSYSAFRGSGAEAGEGGRGGRGRNARGRGRGEKRLPREKKERGEPSRTVRNTIFFSFM